MAKTQWSLIDLQADPAGDIFRESFQIELAEHGLPGCSIRRQTLRGGLRDGVDLVTIDNGCMRVAILPQRGMGVWKAWLDDWTIGWNSPIRGPVHPKFVPIAEPSGLGWLDGFDELLCRCGLLSNGAPDFDARGVLAYPVHGHIANRPAHRLIVEADGDAGEIRVTGVVEECRFHFQKLRLTSTLRMRVGQPSFEIVDDVENLSGNPGEMQLLYHINFGPPLLEPGARTVAAVKKVAPRDARAVRGLDAWQQYGQPRAGSEEEAIYFELLGDLAGQTQTMLCNAAGARGVALRFSTRQLPCYTLWKNNPLEQDGFVTGLEPGTNFPNVRSFEASHGRVRRLAPGEKARFELGFDVLVDAAAVQKCANEIASLQAGHAVEICPQPQAAWSPL